MTKQKTIIIVATLFFLIVQWYGVFFMMYNHPGPLGIDDALAYISNIEFRIAPPAEYILIPDRDQILFSLAYGTLARALGISATAMFHANFYIGLFLMGLALLLFLKKTDRSPLFIAVALGIFAFYEGKGSYHGFFWVVPSFYAILFFILSASALFYSKHRILFSIPLVAMMLLTHSTGLYLAVVLLGALLIHEGLFLRHGRRLKYVLWAGILFIAIAVGSDYLHGLHLFPFSFSKTIESKMSPDAVRMITAENDWRALIGHIGSELLKTVIRHDFAKYYYGLYTPLLAYGIYYIIRERKYPLASIFIAVLAGQLTMAPLTEQSYRFFYPLEIVTWMVIAYGVAKMLETLFFRDIRQQSTTRERVLAWPLLTLSLLFVYNAAHQKASHGWLFKFYNPRYSDADALGSWLHEQQGKSLATYTPETYRGYYLGLPGGHRDLQFRFNASGEEIAKHPEEWLVIGETRKYGKPTKPEFRAYWPLHGKLELKTTALSPGRYKLELIDTGIGNPDGLVVSAGNTSNTIWQSKGLEITIPEEGSYPPALLPWYWNSDKPWPLYNSPLNNVPPVRSSTQHSMKFTLAEKTDRLTITNHRQPLFIIGEILLTNLNTGRRSIFDLYRGDADTLNANLALVRNGMRRPILWNCNKSAPGKQMLFRLEKNFEEVKVFSYYGSDPEL